MAKNLTPGGISTGLPIEADHITQLTDAFTENDAYDVKISGSLQVTGSTSIKGDTDIKGNTTVTDGVLRAANGNIIASIGDIEATLGDVKANSITASSDISASGDLYGTNLIISSDITSSANISASGDLYGTNLIISSDITASNDISASGDLFGNTLTVANNANIGDSLNVTVDIDAGQHIKAVGSITSSNEISASGAFRGFNLFLGSKTSSTNTQPGLIRTSGEINTDSNIICGNNMSVTNTFTCNGAGSFALPLTTANITSSANISASGYVVAQNVTASANISASGIIYGNQLITADDVTIGDNLTVADNITQQATDSILTLGERGDIKTGTNYFLKTETSLQQINLNNLRTNSNQFVFYSGNSYNGYQSRRGGTGNMQLEANNTSTFNILHSDILAEISHISKNTVDANLNINSTWDSGGAGQTGGRIDFGGGGENGTIRMYLKDNTAGSVMYNGNYGLYLSGNTALELNTDRAFKPTAAGFQSTSDSRLKENITIASIDTCYDNVKTLPLKHFKWNSGVMYGEVEDKHVLGWIAQDVKEVLPKAVESGSFTTWSAYTGSVAITGSDNKTILEPGERYQDVLAGSEIIEDRYVLQADQITKMMYGAIQKLQEKVEALELQISGSNS